MACGWALACRRYSANYVGVETSVQAAGAGRWPGAFVAPWDWRKGKRLTSSEAVDDDAGCQIKGNIRSFQSQLPYRYDSRGFEVCLGDVG